MSNQKHGVQLHLKSLSCLWYCLHEEHCREWRIILPPHSPTPLFFFFFLWSHYLPIMNWTNQTARHFHHSLSVRSQPHRWYFLDLLKATCFLLRALIQWLTFMFWIWFFILRTVSLSWTYLYHLVSTHGEIECSLVVVKQTVLTPLSSFLWGAKLTWRSWSCTIVLLWFWFFCFGVDCKGRVVTS